MADDIDKVSEALSKISEIASQVANELRGNNTRQRKLPPKKKQSVDPRSFLLRSDGPPLALANLKTHVYGNHVVCATESRGYPTPGNRGETELRVDASQGFIPLWAKGVTLAWRFNENSMLVFDNPNSAENAIESLFSDALAAWGDAAPVKFVKSSDAWDFEIVMQPAADCDATGCVLASSFFPGGGQQTFNLYPTLFDQSQDDKVTTFCHELGHIFGLRHFFANISETDMPSVLFGTDSQFTIMNYGPDCQLTNADKADLKQLYTQVWKSQDPRTTINGTPIRLMTSFQRQGSAPSNFQSLGGGRCCCCGRP